jgi:hypothetical protein
MLLTISTIEIVFQETKCNDRNSTKKLRRNIRATFFKLCRLCSFREKKATENTNRNINQEKANTVSRALAANTPIGKKPDGEWTVVNLASSKVKPTERRRHM